MTDPSLDVAPSIAEITTILAGHGLTEIVSRFHGDVTAVYAWAPATPTLRHFGSGETAHDAYLRLLANVRRVTA